MRIVIAAALALATGAAQAAECDPARVRGPYLVRVGEHRHIPLWQAMHWASRPPTPQGVDMSCYPDRRGPRVQRIATVRTRPGKVVRPR